MLPWAVVRQLAIWAGWLLWRLRSRTRHIIELNLEITFPDMPAARREQLAQMSLREVCLSIFEMGRTWVWQPGRLLRRVNRITGEEHLQAAVAAGRGAILLLPHLGNWELLNLHVCKQYPVTSLYKERKRAEINDLVRNARQRGGARLVPAGTGGIRSMLMALRAGEVVSMMPDQEPPEAHGEFAPFFGERALTTTLATNLIQRTGAKALCAYCKRVGGGHYEIVFLPADDDIYSPDCVTALAAMNKSIEQCVLDCPEQYQWAYKRFKNLPNQVKRDYFQAS
jgi:KDO2-lipid IV(A) lauroyltransferase